LKDAIINGLAVSFDYLSVYSEVKGREAYPLMVKDFGFSLEDAKAQCNEGIPTLKRWVK